MHIWDALNKVKTDSGLSDRALSARLRRSSGYYSALKAQNRAIKIDTATIIFDACGYGLFAIPNGAEPSNAIRITADND